MKPITVKNKFGNVKTIQELIVTDHFALAETDEMFKNALNNEANRTSDIWFMNDSTKLKISSLNIACPHEWKILKRIVK